MKTIRIIPRLDVKGPNLVKGVHLEGLRVLGKPEDFALKYYQQGADELIYIDTVASLYGRNNLSEIVKKAARNIFIPLTAGGGIRTVEDIRGLLRAGADKVAINTAAVRNPRFINEASKVFGSQCIVISIAAKKRENGKYEALTDNARERSGKDVLDWARQVVDLGAGEILITSVDQEGTGKGFDLDIVRMISESVDVPVIACGGAGNPGHFLEVIKAGMADAVCGASIFHYERLRALQSADNFKEEGNTEFIRQNRGSVKYLEGRIQPVDLPSLKGFLIKNGILCRFTPQPAESQERHKQVPCL